MRLISSHKPQSAGSALCRRFLFLCRRKDREASLIEPKSQAKTCSAHAEILQQNDERTVYRLRETDGEVRITAYPVFPGIELAYHDVHAPSYRLAEPNAAGLIEIQHCREGRAEYCCGGEHYFLAPGDLSVVRRAAIEGEVEFPTGHYHGITVTLDPALAPDCLSCILQDVDVRPSVLAEKFFADSECFVSRSSARVEHIFSELYAVPAGIRRGYFKVKVLELLLFLSALDVAHEKHGYTAAQVRLARAARDALLGKHGGRRYDLRACTGTRCVALAARRELSRRVRHDARSVFARAEDAQCRAAPAHERPHGARYRGAVRL